MEIPGGLSIEKLPSLSDDGCVITQFWIENGIFGNITGQMNNQDLQTRSCGSAP
jgi:hypothetical protein